MDHQGGRLAAGEEEEMVKQQRRGKPPENNNLQVQQQQHNLQQQPQKCPRCDSLNTKFCYYNNYSLSQPRYFCKACRRYWTQGGTLRNVPVGGGCRKGKRSKASSSSSGVGESSRSQSSQVPLPPPPPHELQVPQNNLATKDLANLGLPPMNFQYYSGGGFLSSLAAMQQSLSQPQVPFNQPLNIGGQYGTSSNLGLLQGLNLSSFSSQQQHAQNQHQNEIYQMGPTQSLMQPNRALGSWDPNIINAGSRNPNASNPSATTSLNQNHWPQLP